MPIEPIAANGNDLIPDGEHRPFFQSAIRGAKSTCPSCGEGKVFDGFLKIVDECGSCGEDLSHHRADDLPAYLNIFIVGHVVIGAMVVLMQWEIMGMWAMTFTTIALCVVAALILMRPLKGMVVGTQWALRMHGFGGHDD